MVWGSLPIDHRKILEQIVDYLQIILEEQKVLENELPQIIELLEKEGYK